MRQNVVRHTPRMQTSPLVVVFACALGCGGAHSIDVDQPHDTRLADTHAADTPPEAPVDAAGGRVLRLLTGDATTIRADWSAVEAGIVYPPVKDGDPMLPVISSEHAAGSSSIEFSVPTDHSGHKQRIEYKIARAEDPDGLHFDNEVWAGFAVQLAASPDPFTGSAILWQAWQGYPWGPPVSLKVASGSSAPYRMRLAIRNASTGPDSANADVEVWSGEVLQPGAWTTFLVHVRPRYAGVGELELYMDGAKLVDWNGPIGYDPAQVAGAYAGLDLKDGIYQPGVNNGHTFRFDQIVVATSYEAAAAALGWQ